MAARQSLNASTPHGRTVWELASSGAAGPHPTGSAGARGTPHHAGHQTAAQTALPGAAQPFPPQARPMNKKALSERDICTKYITPALKQAGWDEFSQIREEVSFTKGRIIVQIGRA